MKKLVVGSLLLLAAAAMLLAGCSKKPTSVLAPASGSGIAPLLDVGIGANVIPGQYLVVFKTQQKSDVERWVPELSSALRFQPTFLFRNAVHGFSSRLTPSMVDVLRHDPRVAWIEPDQKVSLNVTQTGATWGLDRSDQRARPLDGSYTYNQTGAGVDAYIIDTGIRFTHSEFGGRAVTGFDAVTTGGTAADQNGHGTHVAGTVGGSTYGIAKGVRLIAVRVLDATGSGSIAGVTAGVDWVTGNHTTAPAVANMSLGGGVSATLDAAVRNSIADGVVYCVSAGNSAVNVSTQSPADVAEAITVAASDINDVFASFSNFGAGVDIIAPGVNITSSWLTSDVATNTISGTSMASPHVTGAAALYLEANPGSTPAAVQSGLIANSTLSTVTLVPTGTPNRLLFALLAGGPPPPPPAAPTLVSPADGATGVSTSPTLTWNASATATSYRVQVATDAGFATIVRDQTVGGTSAAITGLSGATTYFWRVSAANAGGSSAFSAGSSFTTSAAPPPPPAAPTLSSPANGATGVSRTPTLTWNAASGATSYRVQVSTVSTFTTTVFDQSGVTGTSVTLPLLGSRVRYFWRVNASNTGGTSAFSSTFQFRTAR